MDRENKELKVEIKVDDEVGAGVFSNFTNITHSPDEFILDYLFVNPTPPPGFGKLVSRLILTPGHAKRLLLALSENISTYEDRFGEIKVEGNTDQQVTIQ
jgi:hypothetical protein